MHSKYCCIIASHEFINQHITDEIFNMLVLGLPAPAPRVNSFPIFLAHSGSVLLTFSMIPEFYLFDFLKKKHCNKDKISAEMPSCPQKQRPIFCKWDSTNSMLSALLLASGIHLVPDIRSNWSRRVAAASAAFSISVPTAMKPLGNLVGHQPHLWATWASPHPL